MLARSAVRRRLVASGVAGAAALAVGSQLGGVAHAAGGATGTLSPYTSTQVGAVTAPNGDTNPYGIAVVPKTMGTLVAGDVLVADFNHGSTAGAGTTLVQVSPSTGQRTVFATGLPISGPVGLAINPVNDGVWVGDFGATDGSTSNDLLILPTGTVKATYNATTVTAKPGYTGTKPTFNGVWGEGVSAAGGQVSFYYGTTGSGATGTGGGEVWRIDPHPTGTANGQPVNSSYAEVATGLGDNATAKALPVTASNAAGPQGLVYDPANGSLYVANDANNTITVIPGAATATGPVTARTLPVAAGVLNTPENVVVEPGSGDLLVANAGNNTLVALNPVTGAEVGSRLLDTGAPGALFGLAVSTDAAGHPKIYYVDDNSNSLNVLSYAAPAAAASPTATSGTATGTATSGTAAGATSTTAPTAVQAGTGGEAGTGTVPLVLVSLLGAGGAAAVVLGGRRLLRR